MDQRPLPEMQSLDAGPIGGKVTPREIVSRLAPVDFARLRLIFQFLAANAHELKLETGQRLLDAGDWKEFLSETADALAEASIPPQACILKYDNRVFDLDELREKLSPRQAGLFGDAT